MSEDKIDKDDNSQDCYFLKDKGEYVPSEEQEYVQQDDESVQNASEENEQPTEPVASENGQTFFSSLVANWSLASEKFPIMKNTRIWIVLGGILLLIIFLNIFHMGGKSTPQRVAKKAIPLAQGFAQAASPRDDELHAQISQLKQAQNERSSNMEELQEKFSNLQSSIDRANSQQAAMMASINKLTKYVVHVDNQVRVNKNKLFPKPKSGINSVAFKPIVYHLKAAIPGRVWLKGSNDLTMTVAVGNTISRFYGKVIAIDLTKGTVITSSGRVIAYGRDDN